MNRPLIDGMRERLREPPAQDEHDHRSPAEVDERLPQPLAERLLLQLRRPLPLECRVLTPVLADGIPSYEREEGDEDGAEGPRG